MSSGLGIETMVNRARVFAMKGEDEAAKKAYLDALHLDPTHFAALTDIAALAHASGHRSAALTAYRQAVQYHPSNPIGRVNLANLLFEDGDLSGAQSHYKAALAADPDFPQAHQGLAKLLTERGDGTARLHWQKGYVGHAVVPKRCRSVKPGVPVLLLVAAQLGNMPTRRWLDDRIFAVTEIFVEFYDPADPLPPHALIVNAVGDADLCESALLCAEKLVATSTRPVINPPALALATGRAENARRLGAIPGVIAPLTTTLTPAEILAADLRFPLLLRSPGFHTGQHFLYVESSETLTSALAALPGEKLIVIEYLDARGADGMARKYRVMIIDGKLYPLHLAIAKDWKVHYFTSAMAENAAYREEEQRFLDDMPGVLGERAMEALAGIGAQMGLDYAGVDFAIAPDGSLMLFEANATMVVYPPDADPVWDYRHLAVANVLNAAKKMALSRAGVSAPEYGIGRRH